MSDGLDLAAVFVAQQVFEQNAMRERQAGDVGDAFFLERGEAENAVVRAGHTAAWKRRQNCSDSWVDSTISNGFGRGVRRRGGWEGRVTRWRGAADNARGGVVVRKANFKPKRTQTNPIWGWLSISNKCRGMCGVGRFWGEMNWVRW